MDKIAREEFERLFTELKTAPDPDEERCRAMDIYELGYEAGYKARADQESDD